ncbi:hypothetical protein V5O48_013561, partial [Marasmius crinis-equi]
MSFQNSQGATSNNGQFSNIAGNAISFFPNSHGATFYDGQFNNIAGNHQLYKHSGKPSRMSEEHITRKHDTPSQDVTQRLAKKYDASLSTTSDHGRSLGSFTGYMDLRGQESQLSIEEQFVELVVKPCRWLTQREEWGSRPRLVVIDGLDECEGGRTQTRILSIIASSVREPEGLPLQFLISSRPEPAIREFFDTKIFFPLIWYYLLDNDTSTYRDILIFLHDGFAKIRADVKYRSIQFPIVWPDPYDIHRIVRKACGQFVYVVTLLNWIAEGSISPCTALEIVLGLVPDYDGESPFEELDVLYRHILSTHPERQLKRVLKILALILHANEFLETKPSLENIEALLDLSKGEAALALRGLHSVLDISDNGKVTVRHASFTDFLSHSSRSGMFFLDSEYYKTFSASCVIHYLNRLLCDKG